MVGVITCSVTIVSMNFAGCALETGKLTEVNIMSAHDTKTIQILRMRALMYKQEKH